MSDTDKTRPWAVKCLDDPTWLEEDHDHREGACDLPARPTKTASPFGDLATRCQWVASQEFWVRRANGCGCPRCADQDTRKAKARRARHTARVETHDEQRVLIGQALTTGTVVDDLSDIDIFDRMADPEDGFHEDVAWFGFIRDRLGLPGTSLVVDVDAEADRTEVTVLHNDGRRETLRFEQTLSGFYAALVR